MRIALTVEYRGTAFSGWQVQPDRRTVQGILEEAIERAARKMRSACERAPMRVHALAQVAHFDTHSTIPPDKWPLVLNNLLPDDVSVLAAKEVGADFHARRSAVSKTYVYRIFVSRVRRATMWDTHWVTPFPLDVERMRIAARAFVGTHDFTSFRTAGSSAVTTVRTVTEFAVDESAVAYDERGRIAEGEIMLRVSADGFLYNMVRIMAAQLERVGQGLIAPDRIREQLAALDRAAAREIAPAERSLSRVRRLRRHRLKIRKTKNSRAASSAVFSYSECFTV